MRYIRSLTLLFCLFLASPIRSDSVITSRYSGTVVALGFDKDRIVVGADSRELQDPGDPPFDKACKIVPLGKRMFFASMGFQSGADQNNIRRAFGADFAHKAFDEFKSMPNTDSRSRKIAERWGELMSEPIQTFVDHNPDFPGVAPDAAYGVFASSTNDGELVVYVETVHYPTPATGIPPGSTHPRVWADIQTLTGKYGQLIALGPFGEGVMEFLYPHTKEATDAHDKFLAAVRDATQKGQNPDVLAMEMKFAIEAAEKSDQVNIGGHVDVLELVRNGNVKWIYPKSGCDQ
jgi:hypothetical protein